MTKEYTDFLAHYGVKGQKKGVRRYQNEDGSLTEEGKRRYGYFHSYNIQAHAKAMNNPKLKEQTREAHRAAHDKAVRKAERARKASLAIGTAALIWSASRAANLLSRGKLGRATKVAASKAAYYAGRGVGNMKHRKMASNVFRRAGSVVLKPGSYSVS